METYASSHTRRGSGVPEFRTCQCGNLISGIDTHEFCATCLGLEHLRLAIDVPGSCRDCAVFKAKSLRRRLARQVSLSGNHPDLPVGGKKRRSDIEERNCGNGSSSFTQPSSTKKWASVESKEKSQVYTKGASIQSMPSLIKLLKEVTECIIGLQYVWEYRSPSKSVQPHYQCKLCNVSYLQHDMVAHVRGLKHIFRYLKKFHADKVTHEEEEYIKDPAIRKIIKEVAAEVEKTEGRGQLKVVLKEPCEVLAFKGLRTTVPKVPPPPVPGMGQRGPQSFGPRSSNPRFSGEFSNSRFPGEYPPQDGSLSDYPADYGEPGFGGYSTGLDFLDSGMERRPFSDGMGHHRDGDGFGPGGGRDDYGRSGQLEKSPGRMYHDDYRGNQMGSSLIDRPMDKPMERPGLMGVAPESNSLPNTLLTYLDSFRIENESDAQLVLKVTQKLTDVLMEYRLRSVTAGASLNSVPMSSPSFSPSLPRMPSSSDRFSTGVSGTSRYSDGPSRYYK